jgi:CHAT domain-containing protein
MGVLSDAALLKNENIDLITLSACQTAWNANSNGEKISAVAYLNARMPKLLSQLSGVLTMK